MADQFDIVDIVYNAVEPASTGFILYKDQSGDGEKRNHITIRSLALNGKDYVNKGSININIFVKRPSKGVSDRQLMKYHTSFRHVLEISDRMVRTSWRSKRRLRLYKYKI